MEYSTLGTVLLLSHIGHNMTVCYATAIVLALKIFCLTTALNDFEFHGLNWRFIILTAAILVLIANGTITIQTMIDAFRPLAIVAGLLATVAGGGGVELLQNSSDTSPR